MGVTRPRQTHDQLISDGDDYAPRQGESARWWLGQHSFVVEMAGKVIYLYPFLSALPARQVPPVLRAERITHAVVVLGSHDQADHEAADLPGTLRLPLTIPIHYDTFSFNREDVGLFVDYRQVKYPPGDVLVCKHGEQVVFRRDRLHQITNSG